MDLKALLDKHRVKAGFVGGALVVSTAYGSCHFLPEPTEVAEPAVEEVESEEPAVEEPKAEEPSDAEATED